MTVSGTSGSVIVLDVKGALTLTDGADVLRDKVRSLLQQGHKHVLVNLGEVPHGAAGPANLVQAYATTTRQGGQFEVAEHYPAHQRLAHYHEALDGL